MTIIHDLLAQGCDPRSSFQELFEGVLFCCQLQLGGGEEEDTPTFVQNWNFQHVYNYAAAAMLLFSFTICTED